MDAELQAGIDRGRDDQERSTEMGCGSCGGRRFGILRGTFLAGALALLFALFPVLAGCAGSGGKTQGKPSNVMLEPQDSPSGNKARDQYEEMLRDEQEEMNELEDLEELGD